MPDSSATLREWNAAFRKQRKDAVLVLYPTTIQNLPERLSEMFHFDRRGYIVGDDLARAVIPLLDHVEDTARRKGVTYVENRRGVLVGTRRKKDPEGQERRQSGSTFASG